MREKTHRIVNWAVRAIGSKYFFWGIIALFVFQALWVALSFRYPMIFDEHYHFGLIEYFSHQWLPWINNQPASLDQYGALGRQPYLLYHYLMSFPFRIVTLFTNDLAVQVIFMRLVNIGLFAGGLVIFARLFRAMKIQPIFYNITLLFLVLLPVTSFVAATVNYDNAVFLLTALFMFTGVKILKSKTIKLQYYASFLLIGMIGAMSKLAFIPILVGGAIYITIWAIRDKNKSYLDGLVGSFKKSNKLLRIVLIIALILVSFLFVERFGVNIVQYHSLDPGCTAQMEKARCLADPVEARNDDLIKKRTGAPAQIQQYTTIWFNTMVYTTLYSGAGTNKGSQITPPLPITYLVVFFGSIISLAMFFYGFAKFKELSGFWFLFCIISLYLVSLFYITASAYYTYYIPLAIQGRYLLPILPVFIIFALLGTNYAFQNRTFLKLSLLIVFLILYLNGAGVITHILRSEDSWYWQNSKVIEVNHIAKKILQPMVRER